MKTINTWELWDKEWCNANSFYNSKGNAKTKARLKKKWYDEFMGILQRVQSETK